MRDSDVNWCYTEVDATGVGIPGKWGNCGTGCQISKGKVVVNLYELPHGTFCLKKLQVFWMIIDICHFQCAIAISKVEQKRIKMDL